MTPDIESILSRLNQQLVAQREKAAKKPESRYAQIQVRVILDKIKFWEKEQEKLNNNLNSK